jgi:O-antigen/teichoic acid export membrane protein
MSEIAKKSFVTFASRIAMQVTAVVSGIVLARVLGAGPKGSFAFAGTVLGTVAMFYAGQAAAVAWQYGKRGLPSRPVGMTMLSIIVPSGLLIGAALLAVGLFVPGEWPLVAAGVAVPCVIFTQASSAFFLTDSDVRTLNIQVMIPAIGAPLLYIPLILALHLGIEAVLWCWAASYVVCAVYTIFALAKYFRGPRDTQHPLLREQLHYGAQVSANSVVSYLNFRIDVFLVMFMLGAGALGVYSVGIGLGELMWQLSRPITTAAFGRIARGSAEDAAVITAKCMRHSLALVLAACLILFVLAPYAIVLLYGPAFAGAGAVVRTLVPGIISYSMMPTLATYFSQQLGKPRLPLTFSAISMVACAALTALLLPRIGIVGGALATSLSYCTAFAIACAYFLKVTRVPARSLFVLSRADAALYRDLARRVLRYPSSMIARVLNTAKT